MRRSARTPQNNTDKTSNPLESPLSPTESETAFTTDSDVKNSMEYSSLPRSSESAYSSDDRPSVDLEKRNSIGGLRSSEEARRDSGESNGHAMPSVVGSALQSTIPEWVNLALMIGLIFGGCCSNVFALEAIVKEEPEAGHLITFAQFLIVSIEGLIHFFDWKSPTLLAPNQIPIRRWMGVIVLFFSVSVLNNFAFGYHISVPIHIILRSGGSITTMLLGYCIGKRYSRLQVSSILILTVGIVISALSNAKDMGESEHSLPRFLTGLGILFVSQLLGSVMGLYIENTYQKYGSNWREGLFYTHFLSLPLFIPFAQSIKIQFYRLYSSEALPLPSLIPFAPENLKSIQIPHQLFYLLANAITQYVCVRGVNRLSGISSALTVTIVLNIRKLVSLLLSIWLFGNKLSAGVVGGASVVFMGAFVYALEGQRQGKMRREAAAKSRQGDIPERIKEERL